MSLLEIQKPQSNSITFQTLTPIYTGGIGKYGEQLHPSGMLGSVRYFSCLVASALGKTNFEKNVWGTVDGEAQAKKVALQWQSDELEITKLQNVSIPKEGGKSSWYFNQAQKGKLTLKLTRCGISESDWQILLLSLQLQTKWATFGAKDQFGLGVLKSENLPAINWQAIQNAQPLEMPSVHRGFFAKIQFKSTDYGFNLEDGLQWRAYLRNQFRRSNAEKELRHYLFGSLGEFGSAVNISGSYAVDDLKEIRVWGIIPHTTPLKFLNQYDEIIKRLRDSLNGEPDSFAYNVTAQQFESFTKDNDVFSWLKKLAGN